MSKSFDQERLHAEIDANLREAYQQSLNEELPKRFIDLIEKLRSGDITGVSQADKNRAEG